MDPISELVQKILNYKTDSNVEEIKVDLKRVCTKMFGYDNADIGYIQYLYKYYNNEIIFIKRMESMVSSNTMINTRKNSDIEEIRNYLIKIAIIRICQKETINYQDLSNPQYCIKLLDLK